MNPNGWAARAIGRLLVADAPAGLAEALHELGDAQTIFVSDGRWRIETTSVGAPRVIADRRLIERPAADPGALAAALGRLNGRLLFLCGLGDVSVARAAARAGAVTFTVEVDEAKLGRAPELTRVTTLDEAARETAAGRAVAWIGNAVGLCEAMVARGFTPDVGVDLAGDRRVPDGYSPRASDVLNARNPLELARVRLASRERIQLAWRTLTERGMESRAAPRLDRVDSFELDANDPAAPRAWRFERLGRPATEFARDCLRGAAYVDLEGSSLVLADGGGDASTNQIKHWTSDRG